MSLVINGVTITSLPFSPPQPDEVEYPFTALRTFTNYNRGTFFAEFGVEAPPTDPTKPYKTWSDTSGKQLNGQAVYDILSDTGVHELLILTLADASSINLEGPYPYKRFYSAPTTPAMNEGLGGMVGYNASLLSDYQHALALAKALWAPNPAPADAVTQAPDESTIVWNAETRRPWQVSAPSGGNYVAAPLLKQMWGLGISHPGHWVLVVGTISPLWVNAPEPVSNLGVVPTPVRWPLLANEKIEAVSAGMEYVVVRTDLQATKK